MGRLAPRKGRQDVHAGARGHLYAAAVGHDPVNEGGASRQHGPQARTLGGRRSEHVVEGPRGHGEVLPAPRRCPSSRKEIHLN